MSFPSLLLERKGRKRLFKEFEIASEIQHSFIPSELPSIPGLDIASIFQPAKEVGGDFYDFITLPDDNLGIVIADVAGKGMPAALYMALSRALIRACSTHDEKNMISAVQSMNGLIQECTRSDYFVTMFYAIINHETKQMRYVRAGHNPPVLYRKNIDKCLALKGVGVALGMFDSISLEENVVDLENGDVVVFFTDGVTEAINSQKEEYGLARLSQLIAINAEQKADVITLNIITDVMKFAAAEPQFDDITLVVLKRDQ